LRAPSAAFVAVSYLGASNRRFAMLSAEQLLRKLDQLRALPENEWIEFKAATNDFDSRELLGEYFSALSNEANIKGQSEAWLVFGVQDNPIPRPMVGSIYPKGKTLKTPAAAYLVLHRHGKV
jgi:hypothetical protein